MEKIFFAAGGTSQKENGSETILKTELPLYHMRWKWRYQDNAGE
jgi:hypothetical protein